MRLDDPLGDGQAQAGAGVSVRCALDRPATPPSKTRGRSGSAIPPHSSRTETWVRPSGLRSARTTTDPPGAVWRTALPTRLPSSRVSSSPLPVTASRSSSLRVCRRRATSCCWACCSSSPTTSWATSTRLTSAVSSRWCASVELTRESSNRSPTRPSSRPTVCRIWRSAGSGSMTPSSRPSASARSPPPRGCAGRGT